MRSDELSFDEAVKYRTFEKAIALAGIEKVFLLPSDCSFETGEPDISNDEIEKIVQCDPTFFVGFASADPRKESAAEETGKGV